MNNSEKHTGKYYLDEDGVIHENADFDCVSNPFYEKMLDNEKRMMEEQTPEQRQKILASCKTKPGEHLRVRLYPGWNMTIDCGDIILAFFVLFGASIFIPLMISAWIYIFVFIVFVLILKDSEPTVLKSIEIEEHPVPLGKETKLALALQGPQGFSAVRKIRSLSVDLICESVYVAEKTRMREHLFTQRIFATDYPLDFGTEKQVFDMTFRCDTLPTLNAPQGRVFWYFHVSIVEQSNRSREYNFPFVVQQD